MSNKKEVIILETAKLIHSKGYQATTINDILHATNMGKGQFYHYFSSKYDLGIAVIDYLLLSWNKQLIINILTLNQSPKSKLNHMLDWIIDFHTNMTEKHGCPVGNLAIEMSEHDETFRNKIHDFFHCWIHEIGKNLEEMREKGQLDEKIDIEKSAQSIAAMIQGGILLMKTKKDIQILINITDVIRKQFNLVS